MQSGRFGIARWLVVLGVLIGLPVLAIPGVASKIGTFIYSSRHQPLPTVHTESQPAEPSLGPAVVQEYAPVSFTDPEVHGTGVASPSPFVRPSRAVRMPTSDSGDSLPVEPATNLVSPSDSGAAPLVGRPDWSERISAVRLQLERWGAEYMLLEMVGPEEYRFRCRMATNLGAKGAKSFEVAAANPATAAEQMLDEVAQWKAGVSQ